MHASIAHINLIIISSFMNKENIHSVWSYSSNLGSNERASQFKRQPQLRQMGFGVSWGFRGLHHMPVFILQTSPISAILLIITKFMH